MPWATGHQAAFLGEVDGTQTLKIPRWDSLAVGLSKRTPLASGLCEEGRRQDSKSQCLASTLILSLKCHYDLGKTFTVLASVSPSG